MREASLYSGSLSHQDNRFVMRLHPHLVPTRSRLARRLWVGTSAAILAGLAAVGNGCRTKPLLSPDYERSQFDRYDRVRDEYAAQYVFDEFGRRRPNLSGRLMPRD